MGTVTPYSEEFRQKILAVILEKGYPVKGQRNWYYGAIDDTYRHYQECGGIASKDSQISEEHYTSFAGTFAGDEPAIMMTVDKIRCRCGKQRNLLVGTEGTVGDFITALLSVELNVEKRYH